MRNDAKSQVGCSLIRVLEMSEISDAELLLSLVKSPLSMQTFEDVIDACIETFECVCDRFIICVLFAADTPNESKIILISHSWSQFSYKLFEQNKKNSLGLPMDSEVVLAFSLSSRDLITSFSGASRL